jgi:hypothetical protein
LFRLFALAVDTQQAIGVGPQACAGVVVDREPHQNKLT